MDKANNSSPQWILSKLPSAKKQCSMYEQRKLADAQLYFSRIPVDELRQHLQTNKQVIDSYIDSIPYSLVLLETVYSKFYLYDKHDFPAGLLKPEKLLRHLVVYLAQEENEAKTTPTYFKINPTGGLDWKTVEPRAKALVRTVGDSCPKLVSALRQEHMRLEAALEGLGLHGLVNFGDRTLIEVTEAVKQELADHQHRVKAFLGKVDKSVTKQPKDQSHCLYSINGYRGPVPTKSSHQRLMSFRVSEIKCRLVQNENLLQMIGASLTNVDLENLARILQKRVYFDQMLLAELGQVLKIGAQQGCSFQQVVDDPVASQVLVTFAKGYEKLFQMLPSFKADDSGLGDDDDNCLSSESNGGSPTKPSDDISSNGTSSRQDSQDSNRREKVVVDVDCPISFARDLNIYNSSTKLDITSRKTPSLTNVDEIGYGRCAKSKSRQKRYISKSTQQLASKRGVYLSAESLDASCFDVQPPSERFKYCAKATLRSGSQENSSRYELSRCKVELERVRRQLESATLKQQQHDACQDGFFKSIGGLPGFRTNDLIDRYNSIYVDGRASTMEELSEINELRNEEKLQWKILLSVVVLAFRLVQTDIQRSLDDVWTSLRIDKCSLDDDSNCPEATLQVSIVQFLLIRTQRENYSKTIKEVSEEIWRTLFEYPSLKCCKRFNTFVRSCVEVAWELSCSSNVRYNIEYKDVEFDPIRHKRHRSSDIKQKTIERYIWPALVELSSKLCVYRAIVVT